jgi:hypothetical protein
MSGTEDRAPAYMPELLDRGASLLQLQHPQPGPVRFEWWGEDSTTAYLATVEWPRSGTDGPRVVIFRARSGDFVCHSLPGRPFELDHSMFHVDTMAPDEHDELGRQERAGQNPRRVDDLVAAQRRRHSR